VLRARVHYFGEPKLWSPHSTPLDPKWCLGVFRAFRNLRHVKRCKTCLSGLNALFRGNEVVKHSFYSIGPKMMFGCISEHFANLRHVKRCKTCISGLNALFRGNEVVKHPFYSIWPKMMFGSVSGHFAKLRHVKRCKTCIVPESTISGYRSCEAPILLHWTQNDVWVRSEHFPNLPHVRRCKTCASGPNALFRSTEVVKPPFYSIRSKMMFGSVQSIS
jgi:acid stress-induced BolA-like protein IbaG/YrbA